MVKITPSYKEKPASFLKVYLLQIVASPWYKLMSLEPFARWTEIVVIKEPWKSWMLRWRDHIFALRFGWWLRWCSRKKKDMRNAFEMKVWNNLVSCIERKRTLLQPINFSASIFVTVEKWITLFYTSAIPLALTALCRTDAAGRPHH